VAPGERQLCRPGVLPDNLFERPIKPYEERSDRSGGADHFQIQIYSVMPGPWRSCVRVRIGSFNTVKNARERTIMVTEESVLAALDKPRALYGLQQRVDPSNKSTDALQDLLMRMRAAGKVTFDIKGGKWSKA
jgi:hypothetical protein